MEHLKQLRNIGISAHIDSGKTTLTERILFYTGRIHKIGEVKGKGATATMDSMELEKERGITIQSAATFAEWQSTRYQSPNPINIIDTPGHVDFTIEVERALSVLDGAVLVLCAASGVQSQSLTVDRQMRRYNVPRMAFVNKMDLIAADFFNVVEQLQSKLHHKAAVIQCPIGAGENFKGVVDLIERRAIYNHGERGEAVEFGEIPENLKERCEEMRNELLEVLSECDDELAEKYLEDADITNDEIHAVLRSGTLARQVTPVLCGSAYRNKGVQALLDAVCYYLPNPLEVTNNAYIRKGSQEQQVILKTDPNEDLCALAFKLEDTQYGQLTYCRVYQGTLKKGNFIYNSRTGKRHKVGRLVRMHADQREDIDASEAGQIVALFGIDCASGDTFHNGETAFSMRTMFVPDPVISRSVQVKDKTNEGNLSKALSRFSKEDPTFRVERDKETNETIISGMGELHLEVYLERIRREYQCDVEEGAPKVRYRESITQPLRFSFTHKKQTGGSGQYAKIEGDIEPLTEGEFEFVDKVVGGVIPKEYMKAVKAGFTEAMAQGGLVECPIVGLKITVDDGNTHTVDSSELAFKIAARRCLRENFTKAGPVILEPIMKVEIDVPEEFQGTVLGDLTRRRGRVTNTSLTQFGNSIIEADVPLAEMFSYSNDLRSATQGKGEFTMEFGRYERCPRNVQETLVAEAQKRKLAEAK